MRREEERKRWGKVRWDGCSSSGLGSSKRFLPFGGRWEARDHEQEDGEMCHTIPNEAADGYSVKKLEA